MVKPNAWLTSTTVPIWKGKGDMAKCPNYHPIRLLCHTMKIFKQVIEGWLQKIFSVLPNQCGFVQGHGTTDAIHATWLLLERHCEKKKPVHMAVLDLEKAFDRVPHDFIPEGVPEAHVTWIKPLYTSVTSTVAALSEHCHPSQFPVPPRLAPLTSPVCPVYGHSHQGLAIDSFMVTPLRR